MSNSLEGKVVVVTGAGQGIGREIALLCAAEGARVVVNDIGAAPDGEGTNASPAVDVAAEIKGRGGDAVSNTDSIANATSAQKIIQAALDTYGRIDCVVNNAGILRDRMFHNMSEDEWDAVIRVHLYGYYHVSRAAAPHFKAQESGSFVHFTSPSAIVGSMGQANYAAAKMGVVGLSTSIALDMQRFNVRSNAVAPWAWSRLLATIPIKTEEQAARMEMVRTRMRADQIAPICAYLASDLSKDVTGQIFGARGNELYLFSQPRIVRSVHNAQGWDVRSIASTAMAAMRPSFFPITRHTDMMCWDPL